MTKKHRDSKSYAKKKKELKKKETQTPLFVDIRNCDIELEDMSVISVVCPGCRGRINIRKRTQEQIEKELESPYMEVVKQMIKGTDSGATTLIYLMACDTCGYAMTGVDEHTVFVGQSVDIDKLPKAVKPVILDSSKVPKDKLIDDVKVEDLDADYLETIKKEIDEQKAELDSNPLYAKRGIN